MNPRLLSLLTTLARALVRLVLIMHPRAFRRRFGGDIAEAVTDQIRESGSQGWVLATHTAARAPLDAIAALRKQRPTAIAQDTRTVEAISLHFQRSQMSIRSWLLEAATDVRLSIRGFSRDRMFTASVLATLALGMGVNAAMFGVVDRLLVRGPEDIRDAESVRRLQIAVQPPGGRPAERQLRICHLRAAPARAPIL